MKISNFFIERPIFAAVSSIVIFVIGALAYFRLPLSEYPEVVPPTVVVRTTYPGANPTVIADTVASPLEQQINGVEGMLYMFSQATARCAADRRDNRKNFSGLADGCAPRISWQPLQHVVSGESCDSAGQG